MDCFSSADPAAVNSTLLYDHNNDVDNLWFRNDTAGPLESCFPPRPRQFQCTVCLHDRTVYAMCEKLQDGVRMMMEAGGDSVNIYKSDCPAPPAPPPEDAQQSSLPLIIGITVTLLFFFLLIIGVGLYCKYREYCKNWRARTRVETQNNPQEVTEMTLMTAEANEKNQTPPLPSCYGDGINNGSQQHPGV